MVNRMPKYARIAEELKRRIGDGEYPVDSNLPAESALAIEFAVSRMTVRQALDDLVQDQLISREQGRGTIVKDTRYTRSTSGLRGVYEDLTDAGHKPGARVLAFERIPASETVAHELQLGAGELVVHLSRLRLVDDQAFGIQLTHLPSRLVPGLTQNDLENASLYALLEERYGLRLGESEQRIGARLATDDEARSMQIPARSPLVSVRRLTTLVSGEPVELMDAGYRSDLVSYTSTLQRGLEEPDQRRQPRMAFASAD